jgi:hypothetical protein
MPRLAERLMVTPTLLQRFEEEARFEAGDERYYALMQRDNGDFLSHHPFGPTLDIEQLIWATQMLTLLNREMHHNGCWVIVFTDPVQQQLPHVLANPAKHWMYGRYALIFLDEDGDPQFSQEWVAGTTSDYGKWSDVVEAGIFSTAEKCAHSWALWHQHMRVVLEPSRARGELIKRAQGERAPARR